jgi:N-acetylmuramoyl-L-alanine amidase
MALKLGIIVGHTSAKPGARGIGLEHEYHYNTEVAKDLRDYAQQTYSTGPNIVEVELFYRNQGGVAAAYGRADAWGANYTAELHYNSVGNTGVSGTETLSSGSRGSLAFAHAVQEAHCLVMGRGGKSRGIKIRNRQNRDRGWFSLVAGNAPAILTEPGFGSNPSDAQQLFQKRFILGRAIVDCASKL